METRSLPQPRRLAEDMRPHSGVIACVKIFLASRRERRDKEVLQSRVRLVHTGEGNMHGGGAGVAVLDPAVGRGGWNRNCLPFLAIKTIKAN